MVVDKMKKMLFVINSMGVGGAEKCLVELLKVIPKDEYEVHLGLLNIKGAFLDIIPQGVFIHELPKPQKSKVTLLYLIKTFHWIDAITFFLIWIYGRVSHDVYQIHRCQYWNVSSSGLNYDLAVSYAGWSRECVFYLCEKVKAKSKCLWVHEDVSIPGIQKYYKMVERLYRCLDKIFIVSEDGKRRFDSVYPQMKDKTDVLYNIIPIDKIVQMADDGDSFSDDYNGKRLLTVGRIDSQKGYLLAIDTLKFLLDKGYNVKWYIIGGEIGNKYYNKCMELAAQKGVSDHVVFLDIQMNPYSYMRDCDIYVQPSLFEAYCTTIMEALCFGNPIVATCFCSVHEQLKGRENAFITEMTVESLADGIEKALNDKKISVQPAQRTIDLDKLYRLISTK